MARSQLPEAVSFRVLGDGDSARWQQLAAKLGIGGIVSFEGVLPSGSAVHEWLDSIDIYVQPSFQEGLPRATIEAMSRGCPTLGSTAGGIPELLDQECLHRPGQAAEQAERNFSLAGAYTKERLDTKRHVFWRAFGHYVRSGDAISELRTEGANA
jgi:glycosyltransferase involved in cell wall biosynthesis